MPGIAPGQLPAAPTYQQAATAPTRFSSASAGKEWRSTDDPDMSLPAGVYVICLLQVIGVISSFVIGKSPDTYTIAAAVITVILVIGLLMRREAIRKIFVILSVVFIVLTGVHVIELTSVQDRYHQSYRNLQAIVAVDKAKSNSPVPASLQQALDKAKSQTALLDSAYRAAYISDGTQMVILIVVAGYLSRSRVKSYFG